jgi:NADH:ubiquinone oxidoreductase subunit E
VKKRQGWAEMLGSERENLLMLLKHKQKELTHLSRESITDLAGSLGISISEVYGVATFYSFLSIEPIGRNVIRICKSVPCYLQNTQMLIECVANEIGITPGKTTPDGRYSFELTNCIGACDKAPAMLVNDDDHDSLTPEKISQILKSYT